jgi:hypothetical protein
MHYPSKQVTVYRNDEFDIDEMHLIKYCLPGPQESLEEAGLLRYHPEIQ